MAESCFFVDIKKRVPYTDNKECLYKGGKGYELCRNITGTGNRSDVCVNSGRNRVLCGIFLVTYESTESAWL